MRNPWLAGSPGRTASARLLAQIADLGGGGLGLGSRGSGMGWGLWQGGSWLAGGRQRDGPRQPWSCVSGLRQSRTIGLGKLGGDWLGGKGPRPNWVDGGRSGLGGGIGAGLDGLFVVS